jgi:tetratricopeptide (TPR) repeat protein
MLANHYHEALSLAEAAGLDTGALREPARKAFTEAAQRALSLSAGANALQMAKAALELTPDDAPQRPQLALVAGYAGRLVITEAQSELLEAAIDGFIAQGDPGRAAEAAVLLGSQYFYTGEVAAVRQVRDRALELARKAPPVASTARALASIARSLSVIDRDLEAGLELAREALALADQVGDDETASVCLNTIGMVRVFGGDAGGIDDVEQSVERAASGGSVFHLHSALNNLANCLWHVGRLTDASMRIREARALCERYGFASALAWNDAELVYDASYRGDLEAVVDGATRFLTEYADSLVYQARPIRATRSQALLARGQLDDAVADSELALTGMREAGTDAQVATYIVGVAAITFRAAGRLAEAESLLAEAFSGWVDEETYALPLHLVELGRGDEYLALMHGVAGHVWLEAGRAAARGELIRASELYDSMGARFPEAWAGVLAAEHGDTSRLDGALAYFEEQQATPYVQRCRALLQASA